MRAVAASAFLASCCAVLIVLLAPPVAIESQLLRLQLERNFPGQAEDLARMPLEVQAFLVDHADNTQLAGKARLALERYPAMSTRILALYGDDERFQRVLAHYGDLVMPPIAYFLDNESKALTVQWQIARGLEKTKRGLQSWWNEEEEPDQEDSSPAELSPEERGRHAISWIEDEGHGFIGQFILDRNGEVQRVQSSRAAAAVTSFFSSGIRNAETKWRRGDGLTVGDAGSAALDLAVGVSALKVLRLGRTTAQGTKTLSFAQRNNAIGSSLLRGSTVATRLIKYGPWVVSAYIFVRYPSVLNSAFKVLAEWVGLPVALVQLLGWSLVLLPVFLLVTTLLKPFSMLLTAVTRLLLWTHGLVRGKVNATAAPVISATQ